MNKNFYFLMIGYSITMLGSRIGALAQLFKSFEVSSAVYGVSILLLLRMLSNIIVNPINFKILSKYSYKKIIIFSETLNGIVTLGIFIFSENLYLLILLATISCFLNCIFRPAFFSLIPIIVEKDKIHKANSILSSIDSLITFFGYSISGVLIFYFKERFTFLIDTFSYFFSIPLYFFIDNSLFNNKKILKKDESYLKFFKNNIKIINFININFIVWIVSGFFSAIEIPFLKNNVLFSDKVIGNIFSFAAIGNIIGALISNKFLKNVKNIKKSYLICSFLIIFKPIIYISMTYKISFLLFALISGILIVLLKNSVHMFVFSQKNELQDKYFNHLFLINHTGMAIGLILATFLGDKFKYSLLLFSISLAAMIILVVYLFFTNILHKKEI